MYEPKNGWYRRDIQSAITTIHIRLFAHAFPPVSLFCMADKTIREMKLETLRISRSRVSLIIQKRRPKYERTDIPLSSDLALWLFFIVAIMKFPPISFNLSRLMTLCRSLKSKCIGRFLSFIEKKHVFRFGV